MCNNGHKWKCMRSHDDNGLMLNAAFSPFMNICLCVSEWWYSVTSESPPFPMSRYFNWLNWISVDLLLLSVSKTIESPHDLLHWMRNPKLTAFSRFLFSLLSFFSDDLALKSRFFFIYNTSETEKTQQTQHKINSFGKEQHLIYILWMEHQSQKSSSPVKSSEATTSVIHLTITNKLFKDVDRELSFPKIDNKPPLTLLAEEDSSTSVNELTDSSDGSTPLADTTKMIESDDGDCSRSTILVDTKALNRQKELDERYGG